jgi:diguanylate cyclase (GGDEF)-like protein
MKSFPVELGKLLTVVAGKLNSDGVLLEANAGLLRIIGAQPIGSKIGRFFIQPSFAMLTAALNRDGGGYEGLLTIGDFAGMTRTLRGRVWRADRTVMVLAEFDITELERINDAMLSLNRESSVAQYSLSQSNMILEESNATMAQREGQFVVDSLTDALTGVGNRRKLDQALASEIERVRRGEGPLSAIMADVDHFKRVNDDYGHGAGDKVLAQFGALLSSHTRATDVVARFGGEEFIVLLPHTGLSLAITKAEQFRNALASQTIEPLTTAVTSSFGVAELLSGENSESLLRRVDSALYRAKEGGRNRVMAALPNGTIATVTASCAAETNSASSAEAMKFPSDSRDTPSRSSPM